MSRPFRLTVSAPGAATRELAVDPTLPLLTQVHAAGFAVPSACRNGNCGRCDATLLKGQASHLRSTRRLPLCISQAQGNLHVELAVASTHTVYACQLIGISAGHVELRLPAGHIDLKGNSFVLLTQQCAASVELTHRHGRSLGLSVSLHGLEALKSETLVYLLNASRGEQKPYALWCHGVSILSGLGLAAARDIRQSLLHLGIKSQMIKTAQQY